MEGSDGKYRLHLEGMANAGRSGNIGEHDVTKLDKSNWSRRVVCLISYFLCGFATGNFLPGFRSWSGRFLRRLFLRCGGLRVALRLEGLPIRSRYLTM